VSFRVIFGSELFALFGRDKSLENEKHSGWEKNLFVVFIEGIHELVELTFGWNFWFGDGVIEFYGMKGSSLVKYISKSRKTEEQIFLSTKP
jgi:hypothetical protein